MFIFKSKKEKDDEEKERLRLLEEFEYFEKERKEKIDEKLKELNEQLEEILKTETIYEIGDVVTYTKIPNDYKMGVVGFQTSRIITNNWVFKPDSDDYYISDPILHASYFDANGNIQKIKDHSKWFKKI